MVNHQDPYNPYIIKLIMDRKSDLGSSIYFSEKAGSLTSQKEHKHKMRQTAIKVEVVNQNLEDAIK